MAQLPRVETSRPMAAVGARPAGRARLRRRLSPLAQHAVLAAVAVLFMGPFYWMVISGFKDMGEIFARPLVWWQIGRAHV